MAVIVVETGSGDNPAANSYISEAELVTYAADRGITLVGDPSVLIIRAMDYLESQSFKGYKTSNGQPLEWPRSCVIIDIVGFCGCGRYFPNDEIPQLLIDALAEIAIAIDQDEDPTASVQPAVKSETVDVISVTYKDNASSVVINRKIGIKLNKLLDNSGGGFKVVKG